MNLSAFRLAFPEFRSTSDTLIEAVLARTSTRINATVWGAQAEHGHGLLTAHVLSLSPNGQQARLSDKTSATTYGLEYEEIRRQVTALRRTAGSF